MRVFYLLGKEPMKILETRVMRGPNQWSTTQKKLIVLKLQLDDINEAQYRKFSDKIMELFPGFQEKQSREALPGAGIVQIVQHITTDLQTQTGMPCVYTRAKATANPNEYFVIFAYVIEQAGVYAGQIAVEIVNAL